MPGIRKCNSGSNYILIFGKLFHICKLVHIDWKPRILIAWFLLVQLSNNVADFFVCFSVWGAFPIVSLPCATFWSEHLYFAEFWNYNLQFIRTVHRLSSSVFPWCSLIFPKYSLIRPWSSWSFNWFFYGFNRFFHA